MVRSCWQRPSSYAKNWLEKTTDHDDDDDDDYYADNDLQSWKL